MPGRVLNFLEFSDKYSDGSDNQVSLDDIKNASSNFEEGFDEDTYDQPQIGANRPVSGEYEMTPSSPGETGAPSFTSDNSDDMNAPKENEESDEEEEESEESEEEEEETSSKDEGNPEAGANPKKKVDEGFTLVKGFLQFVNEEIEVDDISFPDSGKDDYFSKLVKLDNKIIIGSGRWTFMRPEDERFGVSISEVSKFDKYGREITTIWCDKEKLEETFNGIVAKLKQEMDSWARIPWSNDDYWKRLNSEFGNLKFEGLDEDCKECGDQIGSDKFAEGDICPNCEEEYTEDEYGTSCGCNM
jgi:hypothetical protein